MNANLSAILARYSKLSTTGSSQTMFFKINTVGENTFLNKLCQIVEPGYQRQLNISSSQH